VGLFDDGDNTECVYQGVIFSFISDSDTLLSAVFGDVQGDDKAPDSKSNKESESHIQSKADS
jgi:hypothetical protein